MVVIDYANRHWQITPMVKATKKRTTYNGGG